MAQPDLDVPVRTHLLAAAGLLAAAALVALLAPGPRSVVPYGALVALLGVTLLLEGIAVWYLPSFAKRAVAPRPVARAAPWIALAAAAACLAGLVLLAADGGRAGPVGKGPAPSDVARLAASLGASLLLLSFAALLLVTPLAGPSWRGGVPFWRKEGPHRAGDAAAAAAFASCAGWLSWAAVSALSTALGLLRGDALLAWMAGLALFLLGGLAHLVPRARGAPLLAPLFLAGVALLDVGVLLQMAGLPFAGEAWALGLLLAVAGVAARGRGRGKPEGPRLRQARPLLAAAGAVSVVAVAALLASRLEPDLGFQAYFGFAAALFLAAAGLSLLTLPVLFNQRPDARMVAPAAAAAGLAYALALASALVPRLAPPAFPVLGLAVGFWLAALWPLRKPRRECPPRRAEPS